MIKKIYAVFKSEGLLSFLKFASVRIVSRIVAFPVVCGIILISPLVRIRFIRLFSSRIGHYVSNTETLLCALDMKVESDKKCKTLFYTLPGEPICNAQLHRMWKRTISILPFPSVAFEVDKLLTRFGGKKYRRDPLKNIFEPSGDGRDRWNLFENIRKCHLSFTYQEENKGKALLKELGIPPEASFICLLVRDSHYLTTYMPSIDWSYHDYRNADINSYKLAANYLADKGYYVIRMGKIVKDPFFINHPKVIDYANSKLRSDFMDIYLSAYCFFFISTCTGLDSVARVFRKPLLVTNLVLADFDIWHPWKLFILKKIMDLRNNRILTLKEMNSLYFEMRQKKRIPQLMRERRLRYIDNTPEEIKDVVEEMVGQLTETWRNSEEDEMLQRNFWKDFPKYLVSEDLPQLNVPICEDIKMRVGAAFLKNNLSLLTDMDRSQVHAL